MENPYSPSSEPTIQSGATARTPTALGVAIAAVLTSFAAYIPIVGIRGACFCLFPGISQRSLRIGFIGALIGLVCDIAVSVVWMIIAGAWEPRWGGYNSILIYYLPPDFMVATHVGSPMPNSMKFCLGLMLWSATMHLIWMLIWQPRLDWERRLPIICIGSILVCACAIVLWIVAPLTGTLGGEYQPFGDLPPVPFITVFISTMPICSLVVALLAYWRSFASLEGEEQSD